MAETTPSDAPDFVTAHVDLQVAGSRVQFALTVPTAPVPPGAILPVFQTLSEAIQANVASGLEEQGKQISCRAGCGACCRQLVPITKIEARYLAELVDSMPQPRQSEIRSRFVEVIRRLNEAGILETLRHPEWVLPEAKEKLGLTYFGLGIPCPFLENESCSIHENRPLVCREYLVTSPPEHCANPAGKLVEGVNLLVRMSRYLANFAESKAPGPGSLVLLPLALEWAASNPDESPVRPGPEWVEALFKMVAGKPLVSGVHEAEASAQ
jgi:Fe-S-cluster containining protein